MEIVEVATGIRKKVVVRPIEDTDLTKLTKKRFFFEWKSFYKSTRIFKLQIDGGEDILGVMGLIYYSDEKRIEIKLLASSRENVGKGKIFDRIAGCLIGFACKLAVIEYAEYACVSLIPKTKLKRRYTKKYKMRDAGWHLYLDGGVLVELINEYK